MPGIGKSSRQFPELQEAVCEWEEYVHSGEGARHGTGVFPHTITAGSGGFGALLACPNPQCHGGGFELNFLVESMISEQVKEKSGVLVCIGWEREQRSGSGGTPCTRAISYQMRIRYRGQAAQPPQEKPNGHGS